MSRLNFDTLIIQYNEAIRIVQRLQCIWTDGRTEKLGILGGYISKCIFREYCGAGIFK